MAKNNSSCPICSFSVNRSQWFYSCSVCNKLSLFPRKGLPVNKEQALDNLAKFIQNRQNTAQEFERRDNNQDDTPLDDIELDIEVKIVFNYEDLDGVIINVNGTAFPYYLEEAS